ncbi:hypothetical protein F0562_004594 [Nyssa sinensis]|uniref:Uncharacterized protein n=1 Tax=Nyssa sinensis TaxID=561372 RepID=A0A5J5BYH2_9ASTE|nr:hypothetical protein F0562_004594 [Nyssa sinensis]
METKSDVTEPVSVMKREGEGKELTSESLDITVNQFPPEKMNKAEPWDQPTEAIKFLEKSENMPVATNIEVENVNDVIKGNVGTIEGEIFLGSLSVAKVACEETSRLADDYQAAEILNRAEKLVPENETLREEKLEDQHVEIVANEEASPEENHQNTKEELRGAEKDEKGVTISDEKTETESDKQTLEMLEATPGQNAGAMVQTPDLIEDLNMDTGKLTEDCDREESTDNGAKTASIEACLREASFQGREDKEPETSFDLVGKEMDAEAIQLSKNTEDKKNEGHETPHNSTKDVCIPETEGPDDEEEGIENSRGAKDKPDSPLVTALIDERSLKNAGLDVGGNLEENPSITFEERSQETVETIEKKQLTSTEEDICEKSNLETSVVNKMEDVCFQKVDKPETFKEASETGSEDIVKEGQNELRNQSGIVENIVTTNSSPRSDR